MTTSSSRMGIDLKEEHFLVDVSAMMISELRRHCTPISFLKSCFCDWFPQFSIQHSTECTRTDTLNYDSILFFDRTCHKAQS